MIYIAFAHMLLRRSTWFLDSFLEMNPSATDQSQRSNCDDDPQKDPLQ